MTDPLASHQPDAFFVLRSPLLPYDDLAAWSDGLRAADLLSDAAPTDTPADAPANGDAPDPAADDPLAEAVRADRSTLRARLRALVERPELRKALFIASPDLSNSFELWHRDPDSRRGQRAERAIVRYVERMAARSTPFGLFAGCAVGVIADATRLRLPPRAQYRSYTRPDMHYLCGLTRALEACSPAIRQAIRYHPTTSLYRFAERWQWVEQTPADPVHGYREHRLAASPQLDALLERARAGLPLAELERLPGYVPELLTRRLFISELEPAVTGPVPLQTLIERLDALATTLPDLSSSPSSDPPPDQAIGLPEIADALRAVRQQLDEVDAAGPGGDVQPYREMEARLRQLPGPVDPSKLWQGELVKTPPAPHALPNLLDMPDLPDLPDISGTLTLGADVLAELQRGIQILHRLHRPRPSRLTRFRDEFVLHFEHTDGRQQVPLVEALDPETGIRFGTFTGHDGGTPLLEAIELPGRSGDSTVATGARHTHLLELLAEALARGAYEIELTDADLDRLANPEPLPLPDAISATAALAARSPEALAQGEFRISLEGVVGPSGARLAGRFCHGDAVLRDRVQAHVRAEEAHRPDVVFAEIAHLPEPRGGNIVHRPVFRGYELTYLGESGAPVERQIRLDDLLVSVVGTRVVLHSARLGREIVPRLTSAQNYFHVRTTPFYRFIAALQDQGIATGLGWDWGPLASAPFLPRVSVGRLVLARARWRVGQDEAKLLGDLTGPVLLRAAHRWRLRRGIPRHARLAEYDNELLVDFDNVLSVESWAQLLKGRESATLVEAFPGPDELCVSGPEGRYFHELSVPFLRTPSGEPVLTSTFTTRTEPAAPQSPASLSMPAAPDDSPDAAAPGPLRIPTVPRAVVQRRFPPGSEWLFAKLYAGPSQLDGILRRVVRPLVERALGSGAADSWFFIRYGDPDWHLRLRFHGDPARLTAELLPLLSDQLTPFLERREVQRLQLDTYQREVERYGGATGIPSCEAIFSADSETVLEAVEALDDEGAPDARWKLALAGLDSLLNGLGLDLTAKLAVSRAVRDSFAAEHHADQKTARQIGDRYRVERGSLEAMLDAVTTRDAVTSRDAVTTRPAASEPFAALPPGISSGAVSALARLSERIEAPMRQLRAAADNGELTLPLTDLAPSLLHMHANRLLRSEHRRQEMVLYDFLYRHYDARAARTRSTPGAAAHGLGG